MDFAIEYLGLRLAHPFVVGASPLTADFDTARQLEDAGAAALVLPSLFEEDIAHYDVTADRYLELLVQMKRHVRVPVIASLNGTAPESWLRYARMIEQGGADAMELNFYHVATDPAEDGLHVERRVVDIVAVLKESIGIPLAVKLSPFYSSLPHLAAELDRLGTAGFVLFNRFFQPDIDPDTGQPSLQLTLSDSSELLLRLRWLAILSGRVHASLAATGGVHTAVDAVKAVMAGASAVQLVSALLRHGPGRLAEVRRDFERWGAERGFASVGAMCGCASLARSADPAAFERGNYVRLLHGAHITEALSWSH